jgi:hypothetical protein
MPAKPLGTGKNRKKKAFFCIVKGLFFWGLKGLFLRLNFHGLNFLKFP